MCAISGIISSFVARVTAVSGSWNAENRFAITGTCQCAGQHRRSSNFLIAFHPEKLTESINFFLE